MAKNLESFLELDLVHQAQKGSQAAFGQLYDAYIKKIYDFIYFKTMNQDTAEDISSEVFLKAWRSISQFQGKYFGAWLYKIARNSVIDYYRSRKNLLDIEDCWDLAANNDLFQDLDDLIKVNEIKRVMQNLSSRDRELIMLRIWQDLSFREIAVHLDRQEGAVKMAFSRAIARLRAELPLQLFIIWASLLSSSNK